MELSNINHSRINSREELMIVSGKDYRSPLLMNMREEIHDERDIFVIKTPRRLISEYHDWLVNKCPSNSNTLRLTSWEFWWKSIFLMHHTDEVEEFVCPRLYSLMSITTNLHSIRYIFRNSFVRDEFIILEYHTSCTLICSQFSRRKLINITSLIIDKWPFWRSKITKYRL